MAVLLKAIHRFDAIPIKIPMSKYSSVMFSIEKEILKFIWKHKRPQMT
jgi:hypothetical protein